MSPIPTNNYSFYLFNDNDINNRYVDIDKIRVRKEYPYVRVYFSTDYGVITNDLYSWEENE